MNKELGQRCLSGEADMRVVRLAAFKELIIFASLSFVFIFFGNVPFAGAIENFADKNHVSCVSCHRMTPSDISLDRPFPEGIDPSSVCLDCHHYSDNHHPVNFIPQMEFSNPDMATFPLFDGEIRCLTCHKVHGAQGPVAGKKLLRGGPYIYRSEICFLCHDKDLNTRISPHRMLNDQGDTKKVNGESVCLICHAAVPDQKTDDRVDVTFKADIAFLCWRCHPPMANAFFKGHFLVKPKTRTLEYMIKVQAEDGVMLPLQPRDRITCSTCHNPHQKGVISYGPAQAGEDAPARLRMQNGDVCSSCHNI